jgi:hypothetical protein
MRAVADRRDLALAAFLAWAGMAVAEHRAGSVTDVQREALAELISVGRLLRRLGTDSEEAAAGRPDAAGRPVADLGPAAYCLQVARRADEAIVMIRRSLL